MNVYVLASLGWFGAAIAICLVVFALTRGID